MKQMFLIALCSLGLAVSGCDPGGGVLTPGSVVPMSPASIADRTKVDEQAGITLTLAYTATAKAAALAIQTGLIRDPARIQRIGALDRRAYAAVLAVRQAYLAANSSSYLIAIREANAAINELFDIVRNTRTAASADPPATAPA